MVRTNSYHYIKIMLQNLWFSKHIILKGLKLIDVFTLIIVPSVLQSDSGREFTNKIVSRLTDIGHNLQLCIVNSDTIRVRELLRILTRIVRTCWHPVCTMKNPHWSEGQRFVKSMKNQIFHTGIKRSLYEVLFGSKIKVWLSTSKLPWHTSQNTETEDVSG
jgi:hypothetical protein